MIFLRLPLTLLVGGAFSIGVFWVLWTLISQPINVGEMVEATQIEFSRMREDTQAATKREEKPVREPPPPAPEVPRMAFTTGGVTNNVAQLNPSINTGDLGQMTLTAGTDTDVIPLVRIAPEYPPRALRRGIEGWVQVQFTITETGSVTDAIVVAAEPEGLFDEAALRSISRWRYNPKVEGGVPVERVGVQTVIRFVLEE